MAKRPILNLSSTLAPQPPSEPQHHTSTSTIPTPSQTQSPEPGPGPGPGPPPPSHPRKLLRPQEANAANAANAATATATAASLMKCTLPPHSGTPYTFHTYEEYEVHYKQVHVNRCVACGRNFPSGRVLELHIEENHDPVMEVRRGRGEKTYGCFVDDCEKRCSTPQKRRMHLIDKHMFPRKYNFFIVNDGIDRHTSMLTGPISGLTFASTQPRRISLSAPISSPPKNSRRRRRRSSLVRSEEEGTGRGHLDDSAVDRSFRQPVGSTLTTSQGTSSTGLDMESRLGSQQAGDDDEMADLAKSMSALKFVPKSVALRRQKEKMADLTMRGT